MSHATEIVVRFLIPLLDVLYGTDIRRQVDSGSLYMRQCVSA